IRTNQDCGIWGENYLNPDHAQRIRRDVGVSKSKLDFEILILTAPERQARQPILSVHGILRDFLFTSIKNASAAGKFRAGDLAPHIAWRHFNTRIVSNSLEFSRIAARFYVDLSTSISEPDWGVNSRSILTKGCE